LDGLEKVDRPGLMSVEPTPPRIRGVSEKNAAKKQQLAAAQLRAKRQATPKSDLVRRRQPFRRRLELAREFPRPLVAA
jgi:hypothetical protein